LRLSKLTQVSRLGMFVGRWVSAKRRSTSGSSDMGTSAFLRCVRLRQLRDENARLKRLVADLTLDRHILQEVVKKKI